MDKQKLEEVRQLAMSMTSHPVAFGTIEHTEKAGELLGLLWQEVLRLQCDLKDARDREEKQTLLSVEARIEELREADARYMALLKAVADGVAIQPRTVVLDLGPNARLTAPDTAQRTDDE